MMSLSVLKHNLGTITQLMFVFYQKEYKKKNNIFPNFFIFYPHWIEKHMFYTMTYIYIMLILIEIMLDLWKF
jgi:hypothetical protein